MGIFNKTHQRLGTWMVLDCYPASDYDLNFTIGTTGGKGLKK